MCWIWLTNMLLTEVGTCCRQSWMIVSIELKFILFGAHCPVPTSEFSLYIFVTFNLFRPPRIGGRNILMISNTTSELLWILDDKRTYSCHIHHQHDWSARLNVKPGRIKSTHTIFFWINMLMRLCDAIRISLLFEFYAYSGHVLSLDYLLVIQIAIL